MSWVAEIGTLRHLVDLALARTSAAGAPSGGGGPTGTPQTGVIILPKSSADFAVDIGTINATLDLSQIGTPPDGRWYQIELVGESSTNTLTIDGAPITALINQSATQNEVIITGSGQWVWIKYNAFKGKWYTG
jgi:hypothetical protein